MQAKQPCESPASKTLHPTPLQFRLLQLQMQLDARISLFTAAVAACRMDVLSGDLLLWILATLWPS